MPKITIEVDFDLADYASRYGFSDGDDGAARDAGSNLRSLAVQIIAEELEKAGIFGWRVNECNPCTMHNPCQIEILDGAGEPVEFERSEGAKIFLLFDVPDGDPRKVFADLVWPAAFARFEAEAASCGVLPRE